MRQGHWLAGVVLVCLVAGAVGARGWPGRVQPLYECCCHDENPMCGGCLLCRNYEFKCDCSTCSCYGSEASVQKDDDQDFIQMLLRGGFGGRRDKRSISSQHTREDKEPAFTS